MEEVPPPFLYEGGIDMEQLEIMEGILNAYPYPIVFVDNDYVIRFLNRFARYHYYEERGYGDLIGKSIFDCHLTDARQGKNQTAYEGIKRTARRFLLASTPAISGCI